jgi:hypothetical protein
LKGAGRSATKGATAINKNKGNLEQKGWKPWRPN